MRILLGMCYMTSRTGAELFVRDLALSLNRMGHTVIVFAPIMGDMVEELRANSIACVTDLDCVATAPDILIGNTQIETVLCLAKFPGVPAISICHDRVAQHGQPPMFTRVRAYVAVDANCEERLLLEHGIPPDKVRVIQNGVDLHRFRPRPPLPERPGKAAIFSNYATHRNETESVREACAEEGIELDVIGSNSGSQAKSPEDILSKYDLVFAKARCAMEAMAVGCAVIVLNEGFGMAGMVNSGNVAEWRRWNFGRRLLLRNPIQTDRVRTAIREYSAEDADRVSDYLRTHGSLAATATALENLAMEVLRGEKDSAPVSPAIENAEFARFAFEFLRPPGPSQVAVQVGMLLQQVQQATQSHGLALEENAALRRQIRQSDHELQAERGETQQLRRLNLQLTQSEQCARQEIAGLRRRLDAILASGSWRVTAPLRWLLGKLLRLRPPH